MTQITFSKQDKTHLIEKLQHFADAELDVELGQFDTEFLFDFITQEMGAYFYNQGLYDAQAILSAKFDLISEAIAEIEKPL